MSRAILATLIVLPAPLFAQDQGDHHDDNNDIVVTAILGRNQSDLLSGTSVIAGTDLARELRPTIGETLTRQAGVSATSFGPNASRPVLRGFQGERVRVLADGIGSFDVSNTSVDHAVAINPLTADRIEVLRGPAALLFGSSAIGGVVNVIDSRIPRSRPDEGLHIDGRANYGSASNERTTGGRLDVPLSDAIVAHVDASYAKTGNLRTGGFILVPALRAAALASGDPEIADLAALKGKLPNSGGRNWEVAAGAALVTATGNLGFSISRYDNLYALPVRYSVNPAVEAEAVRLDAQQTRIDLRGELNPGSGMFKSIRLRGGYADYTHDEIDDTGAIGTTFDNKGFEGRLELVQRAHGGWEGAFGAQLFSRDLMITGNEKFLPKSQSGQIGLFTVQSFDLDKVRAELGGRIERTTARAFADVQIGNADIRRRFTAVSGSAGASVEIAPRWRVGLNASYTERAPSPEELFANGPHAGTQAFEVGDPAFSKERSTGLEATLRGSGEGYNMSASFYHSWFKGFIFEAPTGTIMDDLPVFQFGQAPARHYGAEFEASVRLAEVGDFTINLDGVGDFTRARIKGGGPVPRIPALRLLGGLEAQSDRTTGRIEIEWVDGQKRIAAFETATPGYSLVNIALAFKPFGADRGIDLTLSANNIFDVNARRHASFLKDYAPLSGRDIRAGVRFSF